MFNFHTEVQL